MKARSRLAPPAGAVGYMETSPFQAAEQEPLLARTSGLDAGARVTAPQAHALLLPTVAYALFGSSAQLIFGRRDRSRRWSLPQTCRLRGRWWRCRSRSASRLLGCCVSAGSRASPPAQSARYIHRVAVVLIIGQSRKLLGLSI